MKFLIVTNAPLIEKSEKYFAYSPYAREMEIWAKNVTEIAFCCPKWKEENELLVSEIKFSIHHKFWLSDFNVKSKKAIVKLIPQLIFNFCILFKAMVWADHIHLRCPGNVGLLGSLVQILFPNKPKTAKYAGNWDPNAKQPISYKIQKWILSNTFLTKNMQVLVYGEWENQTKNIKPFFTASYSEANIKSIENKSFQEPIKLLFVGTLSAGKQPEYAFELVKKIHLQGHQVQLNVYGDGYLKETLQEFIIQNKLQDCIFMHGNVDEETVTNAYQKSHFLILPSKSEGWPKVVAEAMFWGCIPFATKISCVPSMLGTNEERGLFLKMDSDYDSSKITALFSNTDLYSQMAEKGKNWSRKFTLEHFSKEIQQLLIHD